MVWVHKVDIGISAFGHFLLVEYDKFIDSLLLLFHLPSLVRQLFYLEESSD